MNSTSVSFSSSDVIFIDFEGRHYLVKHTFAAGDCAMLSLLSNPRFAAPVSSSTELWHAIVSFARGESQQECFNTYALIGDWVNMHFEFYLDHVLRPGFWVGMIYFSFGLHWLIGATYILISSMSSGRLKLSPLRSSSRDTSHSLVLILMLLVMSSFTST
jgi:hypothetical protein